MIMLGITATLSVKLCFEHKVNYRATLNARLKPVIPRPQPVKATENSSSQLPVNHQAC